MNAYKLCRLFVLAGLFCGQASLSAEAPRALFDFQHMERGWGEFHAAGFARPVCGVVYRMKDPVTNGVALGGIDTGCIDLDANGTFGYNTIFNTIVPRAGAAVRTPVLAVCVGGKTWALCGPPSKDSFLPHQTAWWPDYVGAGQPAWAASATSIPGWGKSVGKSRYDLSSGKVFCHTPATLRWTSPIGGDVRIDGALWLVRNLGRVQKWELRKNGAALSGGQIAWGPTSAAPQSFAGGSGGAAALTMKVREGDRIELNIEKALGDQDFVAVDFRVTALAGGKTWDVAADWSDTHNPSGPWTYDDTRTRPFQPLEPGRFPQIGFPKEIRYWGHYPVADLEYETDGPVQVALRAWCPFFPGDLKDSMIPGIVLETHLRNTTAQPQSGTILMNFPGPTREEAGGDRFQRSPLEGDLRGVEVKAAAASYALGVLRENVRLGDALGGETGMWTAIAQSLPAPSPARGGASAAVDFSLAAGQEKAVRFVLTWCAPEWKAGGTAAAKSTNTFTHMYARHYPSPAQTARLLAARHESLLRRILAWQQVVYAAKELPPWLRDSLINNLYMITETGLWAQARPPLGKWVRPEDGLFGMIESPRDCPQIECIPCSLYGYIPLVLGCVLDGDWIARFHGLSGVFRPDRARTTLDTLAKANLDPKRCPFGMRVFANPDGSKPQGDFSYWGNAGGFSAEAMMVGMTYMYHGRKAAGEELLHRILDYVAVRNGYLRDFPLVWDIETGRRTYGSDYYQNMMLWSVPAALADQDLSGPCKPGGLVDRVLKASAR